MFVLFVVLVAHECELRPLPVPKDFRSDALYQFEKNGQYGFIDRDGRVVVAATLPNPGRAEFQNGLLKLRDDDASYVDSNGKVLRFSGVAKSESFSEGLALATSGSGDSAMLGYIDISGMFVIPPFLPAVDARYPAELGRFSEGLASFLLRDRTSGFIDRAGRRLITARFLYAEPFADAMAKVIVDGPCKQYAVDPCGFGEHIPRGVSWKVAEKSNLPQCKFTFLDRNGRTLPQRFEEARDFSEGLAAARQGELWGYIDGPEPGPFRPNSRRPNRFIRALQ